MLGDLYGKKAPKKATEEDDDNPVPGIHLPYPRHTAFGEGDDIEYEL